MFLTGEAKPFPFKGDETKLVQVKANPEEFTDKTIILVGVIEVSDYYNHWYADCQTSHHSFRFFEVDADRNLGNKAHLYMLRKNGKTVAKNVAELETLKKDESVVRRVCRVQVVLRPHVWEAGGRWDMFDLIDIQFLNEDQTDWQPWITEPERKSAEEARELAERQEIQRQAAIEAAERAKREAEVKKRESEAEAKRPMFREWTHVPSGKTVKARFKSSMGQQVKLELESGKIVTVIASDLADSDLEYLKKRKN